MICLAGAAGMMLGESLIRPTHATRRESFQHAASKTSKLLLLCALLLVVCGFIEGYVSPDPDFPMMNRVVIVGFGFGIVMVGALSGRLFGTSRAESQPDSTPVAYPELRVSLEHRTFHVFRQRQQRRCAERAQRRGVPPRRERVFLRSQRFVRRRASECAGACASASRLRTRRCRQ